MSQVTVSQASVLTGKSRQTINDATKDGSLSFTKNKRGHKVIDISELSRVYDIVEDIDALSKKSSNKNVEEGDKPSTPKKGLEKEIASIREEILASQTRERRLMEDQIELLKTSVEEARRDKENYVKLLENHNKGGSSAEIELLKQTNESLSDQVSQLLKREEQREKERQEARQRRLDKIKADEEAERSRGFFSKLFG